MVARRRIEEFEIYELGDPISVPKKIPALKCRKMNSTNKEGVWMCASRRCIKMATFIAAAASLREIAKIYHMLCS